MSISFVDFERRRTASLAASTWLQRNLVLVRKHPSHMVFISEPSYGVSFLLNEVETPPPIWIELDELDRDDFVSQGDKLALAVAYALGEPLFGSGLSFNFGLTVLEAHLSLLGPFTIVLSGAEFGVDFASALLDFSGGWRVIIHFASTPEGFELPPGVLLVDEATMQLSREDALDLGRGLFNDSLVLEIYNQSRGVLEPFLTELHGELNLPVPLRPRASGPKLLDEGLTVISKESLLNVLVLQERWIEAFKLAVDHLPDRAPTILLHAGHIYHERGLHERLWRLLARLPEDYTDEGVLYWRLSTASRTGRSETMRDVVERYLTANEAPELRALYAGTLAYRNVAQSEGEAKRAFDAQETPFTTYMAGARVEQLEEKLTLLRLSVELAERSPWPYEFARNAGALAGALINAGKYQDAIHWSGWALERFDQSSLADVQRRLAILNNHIYARLLVDDIVGLHSLLERLEWSLDGAYPALAQLCRSTLGDYHLYIGNPEGALSYYQVNLESTPSEWLGATTHNCVRALIEAGELNRAHSLVSRSLSLASAARGEDWWRLQLAKGMVLALSEPKKSLVPLQGAFANFKTPLIAPWLYQAALYLARTYMSLGSTDQAAVGLQKVNAISSDLGRGGLHFLSGPDELFQDVWVLQGGSAALELRFLGTIEAYLHGKAVALTLRGAEVLSLLLHYPGGLTGEQLLLMLYGDSGSLSALKMTLSRLRRVVPLSSQPYRLAVPCISDVKKVKSLLHEGSVRDALSLYQGPFLLPSDAPKIRELREDLEEHLRQAVLASNDIDALFAFAEQSNDDVEVWEMLLDTLGQDIRRPGVRAKVAQLRETFEHD